MKKFLLLPTIREKIATAFKKADEGSLSEFYKSLESIEFTGELEKDYNNIEDTIKTINMTKLGHDGLVKLAVVTVLTLGPIIIKVLDSKNSDDSKEA